MKRPTTVIFLELYMMLSVRENRKFSQLGAGVWLDALKYIMRDAAYKYIRRLADVGNGYRIQKVYDDRVDDLTTVRYSSEPYGCLKLMLERGLKISDDMGDFAVRLSFNGYAKTLELMNDNIPFETFMSMRYYGLMIDAAASAGELRCLKYIYGLDIKKFRKVKIHLFAEAFGQTIIYNHMECVRWFCETIDKKWLKVNGNVRMSYEMKEYLLDEGFYFYKN